MRSDEKQNDVVMKTKSDVMKQNDVVKKGDVVIKKMRYGEKTM